MPYKTKSTKAHNRGKPRIPSKCEKTGEDHVWSLHKDPYYADIRDFNVYQCTLCKKVEWENKRHLEEKYNDARPKEQGKAV